MAWSNSRLVVNNTTSLGSDGQVLEIKANTSADTTRAITLYGANNLPYLSIFSGGRILWEQPRTVTLGVNGTSQFQIQINGNNRFVIQNDYSGTRQSRFLVNSFSEKNTAYSLNASQGIS